VAVAIPPHPASCCRVSQRRTSSQFEPLSLVLNGWGCPSFLMWQRRNMWPV
jgi:hypothetical protein